MAGEPGTVTTSVRAWDGPTRIFHWMLVGLMISAWASMRYAPAVNDHMLAWHRWNGYAVLVAITWRLLWGIAGSSTSRFRSLLHRPSSAAGYAIDQLRGKQRPFLGHSPLGSYMVLALLAVVGAQALMGLFVVEHNDLTYGPLYKLVSEQTYHRITAIHVRFYYYVILTLVAFHVAANAVYTLVKKDPLIPAMITGRKPAATYEDGHEADIPRNVAVRALTCLAAAIAIVFGGIVLAGGKLL